MDIHGSATREDLLQLVLQQLVETGAARYDDSTDIQIAKGISYPVHQYLVIGRHLGAALAIATGSLRVSTAQITWGQYCPYTLLIQHGKCSHANLAE